MLIIDLCGTGARIRELRIQAGMSVKDLQETLGVSSQAIFKWQSGLAMPSVDNLVMLSAIFKVTIDEIIVTIRSA